MRAGVEEKVKRFLRAKRSHWQRCTLRKLMPCSWKPKKLACFKWTEREREIGQITGGVLVYVPNLKRQNSFCLFERISMSKGKKKAGTDGLHLWPRISAPRKTKRRWFCSIQLLNALSSKARVIEPKLILSKEILVNIQGPGISLYVEMENKAHWSERATFITERRRAARKKSKRK